MSVTRLPRGVHPRHIYYYSDALRVKTRHTPGFAYDCDCGATGKWRSTWRQAVEDYHDHKLEAHGSTD